MQIVINHLTRMARGYMCVAGLELETLSHIRPVTIGRLSNRLLATEGDPFQIAAIVDIGPVVDVGQVPEVEDRRFEPFRAVRVGKLGERHFWKALKDVSEASLQAIFGAELEKRGAHSCAVDIGTGTASLGVMREAAVAQVYLRNRAGRNPDIRVALEDDDLGDLDLGLTDIRFFEEDHLTPNERTVKDVNKRISRGVDVMLSVGLGRPFPEDDPLHWLQVNNIHLGDNPTWNLD